MRKLFKPALWPHWQFIALSHSSAVLGLATEESTTVAAFSQLTHVVKKAAEKQLGLVILKGLEILFSLSLSQNREHSHKVRPAKLSPAAPTVHPDCPPHTLDTAGTRHSGKPIPATSLTGDGFSLLKFLLAEATLTQSTLKWKHPLKWCYWQCFNIFVYFKTDQFILLLLIQLFFFFSVCQQT